MTERQRHPWLTDSGVTLLELVVALGILSLAYAFALPLLRGPTRSVELQTFAQDIVNYLRTARAEAIMTGRPTAIVFDVPGRRVLPAGTRVPRSFPASATVSLQSSRELQTEAGGQQIMFYPDGSSSGGRVILDQAGRRIVVGVEWLTGLAHLEARS